MPIALGLLAFLLEVSECLILADSNVQLSESRENTTSLSKS